MPIFSVNSPFMTNASLTETQTMRSTPLAKNAGASSL
jgi:hypothetical protein